MQRKDLQNAGVAFSAKEHTYTRRSDGKALQGVTTMIGQLLYPDEYAGVDPETLSAKAAWGTRRHREIQDMIVFGDAPSTEAQKAFAAMMEQAGLEPIASEYTVTDGENFASNIDVVCSDGTLIDIKTVASLNRAKVSWQLSLYAKFYEHTNPGCKAGKLYAAWIPKQGAPRLVEIFRRSDEELCALMGSWLRGEPYLHNTRLNRADIEQAATLKLQIENLTEAYKALADRILADMEAKGETSYSDDYCTVSYRGEGTSKKFDVTSFRQADPETYSRYVRESATSKSLTMRLR